VEENGAVISSIVAGLISTSKGPPEAYKYKGSSG
jgi:hypothetical protein